MNVTGHQAPPGRPKLTWYDLVKQDRKSLRMSVTNPLDCPAWRGRLQLTARPHPCKRNNQKSG